MKRILLVAALGAISLSACAKSPQADSPGEATSTAAAASKVAKPAPRTAEARTVAAIAQLNPNAELLATIPQSERIVFAPPNPVHTVTVFTDVECGYCRKLHSEIAEYNAQGIAVEYLAFPRMGIGSEDFDKMVSVWCSDDRKKALTEAKTTGVVADKSCKNTVTMQYNVGQRAGLTGTPMILAEDGTQLGGYVPPKALREALDKLAADNKAAGA